MTTVFASSTIGIAIYSIVYTASKTFTATLVANLNAAASGGTSGVFNGDLASAPIVLDFTANQYVVGTMVSDATTLKMVGAPIVAGAGALKWTTTARASATDWPASFTQTSVGANSSVAIWVALLTAAGKNWF